MDEKKAIQPQQPSTITNPSPQGSQPNAKPAQPAGIPIPTSPQPKKSILKKPLFWIAVIVLFLFAAMYYFVYSNLSNIMPQQKNNNPVVPVPTIKNSYYPIDNSLSTWDTFTYGDLAFRYPSAFSADFNDDSDTDNSHRVTEISRNSPNGRSGSWLIAVDYFDNPKRLTLEQLDASLEVTDDLSGTHSPGLASTKNVEVSLNNIKKAYLQKDVLCEPVACDRYIIPLDQKVHVITFIKNDQNIPKNTIDQIISTVILLENDKIDPVTNWRTYTDAKYAFSFNYPPNYSVKPYTMGISLESNSAPKIDIAFAKATSDIDKVEPFKSFAFRRATWNCGADGHTESEDCDKIVQESPIQNQYNLTGYKFYLNWRRYTSNGAELVVIKNTTVGPVFTYDVSKQTDNALRVIQLAPPHFSDSKNTLDPATLEKIGDSIRFLR